MGRRQDALEAIPEAFELDRQLAEDYPPALNPDFALSLNNLSDRLSEVGRYVCIPMAIIYCTS